MATLPVYDRNGQEVGSYELDPAELAPGINRQLLHDVVVMYEANRRVGTVRTKGRSDVIGSTRKLYRQKGTGNARMGTRRTNLRRGGGMAFAKRPKDWGYRLPKKAVRAATRMALLSKVLDDQITVLDGFSLQEPRTREIAALLQALELDRTTCLLTIAEYDPIVWKSARNIPTLRVLPASDLNAYDVLCQEQWVVTREALDRIREAAAAKQAATA